MTNLALWREEQDREILLHSDERKWVKDATRPPFRWICSIEVEFPEPVVYALGTLEHPGHSWVDLKPTIQGCGTGLLVTPKHVLTAAHVLAGLKLVSDRKTGKIRFLVVYAKKVRVIPGRNELNGKNAKPFGAFESRLVHISPEYVMGMELQLTKMTRTHIRNVLPNDYGVIEVLPQKDNKILSYTLPAERISWWGKQLGYFMKPVETAFDWRLKRAKVNIAGYPGEKSKIPCSTLWHAFDSVVDVFPKINGKVLDLMLYKADTSEGMSGSPVWIKCKDGRRYLAGVHSSFFEYSERKTGKKVTTNVAAVITRRVIAQLRRWGVGKSNRL